MLKKSKIGFDRSIRLEWLDFVVAKISSGASGAEVKQLLWNFLEGIETGNTNNSGRGKTLTVVNRIWISVPAHAELLKKEALNCVIEASSEKRIAIHWAMCAATHPFFFDVAMQVGKLIRLHGSANRTQIKRRMVEVWGDRSTLERTIQHVLKSLSQWGLLQAGNNYGSLVGAHTLINLDKDISKILIYSLLLAQNKAMLFSEACKHPAFFPFNLEVTVGDLAESQYFNIYRQGDNSDLIDIKS